MSDWIVQLLTGEMTASMSLAGYKDNFVNSSYPSAKVLDTMAPKFSHLLKLVPHPVARPGERVGSLTAEAAALTGLPEGIYISTQAPCSRSDLISCSSKEFVKVIFAFVKPSSSNLLRHFLD